jgi:CubicO group peptidase (beta-lactamase class C family)
MWIRPALISIFLSLASVSVPAQDLTTILDEADALEPLEVVIIARNGEIIAEHGYDGHDPAAPTNIKSASKTVMSALVGMAIDKGMLEGVEQRVADLLPDDLPEDADPRLNDITIGHLLSMQAGLAPTSGANYGRWVVSRNWVRSALAQDFEADPGGPMLYSTGSTHLLSAILTKVSGQSTLALARDWFAPLQDFGIGGWARDPQGIYLGGNEMAMSPRSLLAFGELYRTGGLAADGTRLLSQEWIDQSWMQRTRSIHTGDAYGYGWFFREANGEGVRYAWGFGGQMLFIIPSLDLTIVMTSDESLPSAANGYLNHLNDLLTEIVVAVRNEDQPEIVENPAIPADKPSSMRNPQR